MSYGRPVEATIPSGSTRATSHSVGRGLYSGAAIDGGCIDLCRTLVAAGGGAEWLETGPLQRLDVAPR